MAASHFGLMGASSLPPLSGNRAADIKSFARKFSGEVSPRARQHKESQSQSQPVSAGPTPPVSPYRDELGKLPG